jgi:hypothetical protein
MDKITLTVKNFVAHERFMWNKTDNLGTFQNRYTMIMMYSFILYLLLQTIFYFTS